MTRASNRTGVIVFSYGSNMCLERLQGRVGPVEILEVGFVPEHDLRFHKRSDVDGSGKGDGYFTGASDDRLWGVVSRLTARAKLRLDRVEGLGVGYRESRVQVHIGSSIIEASMYVALSHAIEPALRPFRWYKQLVLVGAERSGLPADYVARIRATRADPDPDGSRRARNLTVLAGRDV